MMVSVAVLQTVHRETRRRWAGGRRARPGAGALLRAGVVKKPFGFETNSAQSFPIRRPLPVTIPEQGLCRNHPAAWGAPVQAGKGLSEKHERHPKCFPAPAGVAPGSAVIPPDDMTLVRHKKPRSCFTGSPKQ